MTRATEISAVVLLLLTGLVLGQIGLLAGHAAPGVAESNSSPRTLATARAFYDGIDRLLASGDRSIETTVAPGFVDHKQNGQDDRTLPEMIDWLLALRATWPRLRIEVADLQQRNRIVAVRLTIDPGAPAPIPGISLPAPAPIQAQEFLQVQGAAITDRWDSGAPLPVVTLALTAHLDWNRALLAMPAIERISLEPGRTLWLPLDPTLILQVESGSVQPDRAGTDPDGTERFAQALLDVGQVRIFEGEGMLPLRNVSSKWVRLLVFDVYGASVSGDATADSTRRQTIAFMPMLRSSVVRDHQRISITRVSLPPGATVAAHVPGGIEAIAVLDGALDVTVGHGRALMCMDGRTAHPFDDTVTITAGQGVSANELASLSYQVAGPQPATLLIMRIDSSPPGNIPN